MSLKLNSAVLPLLLFITFLSSGCGNHDPQPTEKAFENPRVPPAGTISRGEKNFILGKNGYPEGMKVDAEFIAEGKRNFERTCSACHGLSGKGNGIAATRGLSEVPSFHSEEMKVFSPEDLFVVMSDGLGRMPSYARRLTVEERWKTAAYVKTLQLSFAIPAKNLEAKDRERLP